MCIIIYAWSDIIFSFQSLSQWSTLISHKNQFTRRWSAQIIKWEINTYNKNIYVAMGGYFYFKSIIGIAAAIFLAYRIAEK